jgi:hypothetical protein
MTMTHRAACSAEHGDRRGLGTLELADDRLTFSGAFEISLALGDIELLRVHRGVLEITWPGGTAAFGLGGRNAQDWADLIRGPRPLLDKLGVRQGARVVVCGVSDFSFRRRLQERAAAVLDRAAAARDPGVDAVFLSAEHSDALLALPELGRLLAPGGAVWVVRPTHGPGPSEDDLRQAARSAGLVVMKAVDFSATHTAHKLVVSPGRA